MNEKIKVYWEKAKAALKKLPKKLYILMLVGLVVIAAGLTIYLNSRPYSVLFTGLNSEEATSIMSYLDENGITDYRLENSDTIMVPKAQENVLKMKLLMEGYPKSGFAYSTYYDHVSALSTESERNQAYILQLQDRMGAVIRCMDGVKNAIVTITPGEDRRYVLDSANVVEATAAVMVEMRDGQKLTKQQAQAIRTLVARSVQGLEIESVGITDTLGNNYSIGDGTEASGDASQLKLLLEEEYNNKIRTNIMQVLVPLYGEENVRVGVNCNVDVNREVSNATDVFLPEWANDGSTNGEGIIGSKVYDHAIVRDPNSTTGGVVGAEENSDLSEYVEREQTPDGNEREILTSGQVDYDNPRKETQTERLAGYITDCMVSVSINSTTAGTVDIAPLREHVARAAGISDELAISKISILPTPFYVPEPVIPIAPGQTVPVWVLYAAAAGLALFLILLIIILLVRKKHRKKNAEAAYNNQMDLDALLAAAAAGGAPAEPVTGADVMSLQTERSMELRRDIRRFADENPEIAAQMVKAWLRGGEEDA